MLSFFSSCSSCLSCCPSFYIRKSGTFNDNINPRMLSLNNGEVSCQLVTLSKYNPNEKKFTELAPDDLRLATDVGQFFIKSEDNINDAQKIINSAEQTIPNSLPCNSISTSINRNDDEIESIQKIKANRFESNHHLF